MHKRLGTGVDMNKVDNVSVKFHVLKLETNLISDLENWLCKLKVDLLKFHTVFKNITSYANH